MDRRQFLKTVATSAIGIAAGSCAFADNQKAKTPNIIFILVDDLGYGDLGCFGQKQIKTPDIDKMASEGMRFTNHYAGSTVCAPSRCSLMTGQHTGHCRIRGNSRLPIKAEDVTVAEVLKTWRNIPELHLVKHYHDRPDYIDALAESITEHWQQTNRAEKLLFSFHGIPKAYFDAGDPYYCECHKTARLVAEKLKLDEEEWMLTFQSRFGPKEWLKPYTDITLKELASQGIKNVAVVCPGFSADCLETLEEINIRYRKTFLTAGGENFIYIPALNDRPAHINALTNIILNHI